MNKKAEIINNNLEITKNAEMFFFEKSDKPNLQNELLEKANSVEFIGGLFSNMIDPPFKVFLKRIIIKNYTEEISERLIKKISEIDIYNDDNDKTFKDFIIEKAEKNGIKDDDYLFDSTTINIRVATRICFGEIYKSDSRAVKEVYKEKGLERQKKPISRENVFFMSFALNLSIDDLNELLMKGLKQQSICFKNPYEVISWWALKSDLPVKYEKFQELKPLIYKIDSNLTDYVNTNYYQNIAEKLSNENELHEYLLSLAGWNRQKVKGPKDSEKIVVNQSKRAKEQFTKLYSNILTLSNSIENQPSYQIEKKLVERDRRLCEITKEKEDEGCHMSILESEHKANDMILEKMENKIQKLNEEYEMLEVLSDTICWEDLASTSWLNDIEINDNMNEFISKELYDSSYDKKFINRKRFQILNRESLRIHNIEDIINSKKEISRDHILILGFYYYYLLLKNDFYKNWTVKSYDIHTDDEIEDEEIEEDDFLSHYGSANWEDFRRKRNVVNNKEMFFDFKDVLDEYLRNAGFSTVYLPNSMDSFIIMCLLASDPISCFRRFINLEI